MSASALDWLTLPALDAQTAQALGQTLAAMDPWATLGYSADGLAQGLRTQHPDLLRHLALRQGRPVGLVAVRCPWLRGAYIELFAVLPGDQGRGIGGALMTHVEGVYGARTSNLWLLVSGFNARAQRFYADHGFTPVGTLVDLVAEGQDEILMRKRLPALVPPA